MQDSGHDQAQRGQKPRQNAKSRVEIVDLRAFLRFPGAAASLQATKAKNQRSRDSYAGFRPRQSPARPKHRYNTKSRDLRAFLRFPGAVTLVHGRYNELVFMGFINQLTSLGGTILYMYIYIYNRSKT